MNPPSIPINPQTSSDDSYLRSISDGDSAYDSETGDFSPAIFKYIHDMLMEEDLEDKTCMLQDSLALQAAEKSFYDVIGEKCPSSTDDFPPCSDQNLERQGENFTPTGNVDGSGSITDANNYSVDSNWILDHAGFDSSILQSSYVCSTTPNLHGETQPFGCFTETMGSACNSFLHSHCSPMSNVSSEPLELEEEKRGRYYSSIRTKEKRCGERDDNGYLEEGRSNKYSLVMESEQLELLDNLFLHKVSIKESMPCPLYDESLNEASKMLQQNEQLQAPDMRLRRLTHKRETQLLALLNQCAQAVGSDDRRVAGEQLKQIREHSTPFGDAYQRLAHYFSNGLEARLNGTGMLHSKPVLGRSTTVVDILKAYQQHVSIFPFRRMTNFFANRTIAKLTEKARSIHIIDFGIGYGFQWPCFIHRLSTRPNGPPKICVTGIELPQPGFRPAELVEETGRRLKRVAENLNVPFQYNAIAKKWETIRYEDLKINREEVIAVNCIYRLKDLPDDTVVLNSPRDAVLKLIKRINPDIFLHGISNGSYNAPFFMTRFREALFHFSALFDMYEAAAAREDQERLVYESEVIGREAMNVIACEGIERVERPETYKQWQARHLRIGFRQLPLTQQILRRVRNIKSNFHKHFVVDEDGRWLLMGWKGKIIHAISAWEPVRGQD